MTQPGCNPLSVNVCISVCFDCALRPSFPPSCSCRSHREPVDGILCEHHQLKPDVPFEIVPEELWAVVEQVYSVIEATSGRGTVPLSAIRAIDREKVSIERGKARVYVSSASV